MTDRVTCLQQLLESVLHTDFPNFSSVRATKISKFSSDNFLCFTRVSPYSSALPLFQLRPHLKMGPALGGLPCHLSSQAMLRLAVSSVGDVDIAAELNSYETACLIDPELRIFDAALQQRRRSASCHSTSCGPPPPTNWR